MHESQEDLRQLEDILQGSQESAGEYLKTVFTPERQMTAQEISDALTGVRVIVVATTSSAGKPLTSPVDGIFFQGHFYFGTSPESVRLAHIRRGSSISATYAEGESVAVVIHGEPELIDFTASEHAAFRDCLIEVYSPRYGDDWIEWAEDSAIYARIVPRAMFTFRMRDDDTPG